MTHHLHRALLLLTAVGCSSAPRPPRVPAVVAPTATAPATAMVAPESAAADSTVLVPVQSLTLDNGLRIVVSRDVSAPTVTVAVYYGIGFRVEPRNRTGFAHLFEHMMFQGSANLGKMEFIRRINASGGTVNGSTRFDFTNYMETVPANALEPVLWAEADRMRGLAITAESLTNQKAVVSNEVRVNVLNSPYGGFPWLLMPQAANTNWYNAHNFYGDLADIEAATLDDVQAFFRTYYVPANAVVAIVGDVDPSTALEQATKYFGDIPGGTRPPLPDLTEPPQTAERRRTHTDTFAERPALAVAWHMPPRNTPEFWAMAWIQQILASGVDSRLHQSLVQKHGYTSAVSTSINALGHQFNYSGPMLFDIDLVHDVTTSPGAILAAIDAEIERLAREPIDDDTVARARTKVRAYLYGLFESPFGRADLLATAMLFDNDPQRVNQLEAHLMRVTPSQIQATARSILRKENRTILVLQPAATGPAKEAK